MRLQNPRLEWVSPPTPAPLSASAPASPPDTLENLSRWRRPIDRTTSGEYAANTYSTVGRGFRYLPTSIRTACGLVDDATSSYNSDAVYGRYRPINQKAVVVHAFGVYSDSGRADAGLADEAAVMTDLRGALKDCLCGNPEMSDYFAFLPLTAADRAQVQSALSIIQEFESDNNYRCAGQTSPLGSPCDTGRASAVCTFIYDYQSSRFSTWDGSTPIADSADNSIAKLRAAEAYNKEIYELISKLLLEYVYAS